MSVKLLINRFVEIVDKAARNYSDCKVNTIALFARFKFFRRSKIVKIHDAIPSFRIRYPMRIGHKDTFKEKCGLQVVTVAHRLLLLAFLTTHRRFFFLRACL